MNNHTEENNWNSRMLLDDEQPEQPTLRNYRKFVLEKFPNAKAIQLYKDGIPTPNWFINLSEEEGIAIKRVYSNEYGAWYAAYFEIITTEPQPSDNINF